MAIEQYNILKMFLFIWASSELAWRVSPQPYAACCQIRTSNQRAYIRVRPPPIDQQSAGLVHSHYILGIEPAFGPGTVVITSKGILCEHPCKGRIRPAVRTKSVAIPFTPWSATQIGMRRRPLGLLGHNNRPC